MLVAVTILGGLMSSGEIASRKFSLQEQAPIVSRAWFVDAYSWFRGQTVQPVVYLARKRDTQGNR